MRDKVRHVASYTGRIVASALVAAFLISNIAIATDPVIGSHGKLVYNDGGNTIVIDSADFGNAVTIAENYAAAADTTVVNNVKAFTLADMPNIKQGVDAVNTNVSGLTTRVSLMETAIGDTNTGLMHDMAAVTAETARLKQNVEKMDRSSGYPLLIDWNSPEMLSNADQHLFGYTECKHNGILVDPGSLLFVSPGDVIEFNHTAFDDSLYYTTSGGTAMIGRTPIGSSVQFIDDGVLNGSRTEAINTAFGLRLVVPDDYAGFGELIFACNPNSGTGSRISRNYEAKKLIFSPICLELFISWDDNLIESVSYRGQLVENGSIVSMYGNTTNTTQGLEIRSKTSCRWHLRHANQEYTLNTSTNVVEGFSLIYRPFMMYNSTSQNKHSNAYYGKSGIMNITGTTSDLYIDTAGVPSVYINTSGSTWATSIWRVN